jgi:hypothetical protein
VTVEAAAGDHLADRPVEVAAAEDDLVKAVDVPKPISSR